MAGIQALGFYLLNLQNQPQIAVWVRVKGILPCTKRTFRTKAQTLTGFVSLLKQG